MCQNQIGFESLIVENEIMRFAAVINPNVDAGAAANVVAVVIGGLQCNGFVQPIVDTDGYAHAAICWNLVVLKAKSMTQLRTLLLAAREKSIQAVAFTNCGQELSNSFSAYKDKITQSGVNDFKIVAVGLFGPDSVIRSLTKSFSIFK